MRKLIAGFVAGLTLATVGTAGATIAYHSWNEEGATYRCAGSSSSAGCKETNWRVNYSVTIQPGFVLVRFGSRLLFACERGVLPQGNCTTAPFLQ